MGRRRLPQLLPCAAAECSFRLGEAPAALAERIFDPRNQQRVGSGVDTRRHQASKLNRGNCRFKPRGLG